MIILKIEIEEKNMKGKLNKRIAVIIITIFILVMVLYNLQFKIFNSLYNKKNKLAEIIYQINKNNSKFSMEVNDLFEEQLKNIIEEYKKDEISSEELENKTNEFFQYKDSSSEISKIKEQKNNYEQANQYFENKDYENALKLYNKLDNEYMNLEDKINSCKQELKQTTISTANELKDEQKYSEAIQALSKIKSYYKSDSDIESILSELDS